MLHNPATLSAWKPGRFFYLGLAIVLLANGLPFIPAWYTFIHMWRVELAASVFLAGTLIYLYVTRRSTLQFAAYPDELKLIVFPILAFILWSTVSALWAPSWKSAIHHSLIWAEYLIFYLLFRELLSRGANFRKLLGLFAFAVVYFSIPAVLEFCAYMTFGGGTTIGMRFAKFGEQAVTILPLALLFAVRAKGRLFAASTAAIALIWLLVFCTFGRINYFLFGCVIVGLFLCLLISRTHRRYIPKFALVVSVLVVAPLPLQLFSAFTPGSNVSPMTRFNDTEALNNSNNFRKLMISVSAEMIREHPVTGIGADNFGMQVNRYREIYGANHPDDVNLAAAEDQIPGHAHNEFLQIVAELGAVGGALMLWILGGIALMVFRALKGVRSGSLYPITALMGLVMFLASSLVSAYSFRVMQNGIFFFFVLAFAAGRTLRPQQSTERRWVKFPAGARLAFTVGLVICAGLAAYSTVRVSSAIITASANQTRPLAAAMPIYELAMRLDDENPDVRTNLGMRLFGARRYSEAIPYLESAIAIGRAPSAEISYLASAQSLSGDDSGAERSLASAAAMYPRSTFVLTRYAIILDKNGQAKEAGEVFGRALAIDRRSANTWRALINSGPKAVSDLAARDPEYLAVMDLRPQGSIYAVVTERLIRFPEERQYSFASRATDEE